MSISTQFVLLGAGRPSSVISKNSPVYKRLNQEGLPWINLALGPEIKQRQFIAGYDVEKAPLRYPGFTISVNENWEETGPVASLMCANFSQKTNLLVSYSDIVFRNTIVQKLIRDEADIVLAIDTTWKNRYARRSESDLIAAEKVKINNGSLREINVSIPIDEAYGEFIGLVKFSPKVVEFLCSKDIFGKDFIEQATLPHLLDKLLHMETLSSSWYDLEGEWAELNAPQDLAHFVFGTKAETLDRLKPALVSMHIEEQVRFKVEEFEKAPDSIIQSLQHKFKDEPVIIRSSAKSEDSWDSANAGAYDSILNVDPADKLTLQKSIRTVIASYDNCQGDDQVLVQRMINEVTASGVVFTRTLSYGAAYFAINFDELAGKTDTVTGGTGYPQMLFIHHDASELPKNAPAWTNDLVTGLQELIGLVGHDSLDIEFCISRGDQISLLQVRPLAVDHSKWIVDDNHLAEELREASSRFSALSAKSANSYGSKAVFGVMPDWNPAEIIGTRPGLLSSSLYRYLICDEIWATQRAELGYKDVRPQPLVISFAGHPYVNVRASMSSFLPQELPDDLSNRLVDHYLDRLVENPDFHDKVEFQVALTCIALDFESRIRDQLDPAGFSPKDIDTLRRGLLKITQNAMARYEDDLADIACLAKRFDKLMKQDFSPLERSCMLLEDCKRYGTLAFSHLARGAFIAMTMLKSAVKQGYISTSELDIYLGSISTVAKEFTMDCANVAKDEAKWDAFIERYGHLRPGTYDITSLSYKERSEFIRGQLIHDLPKVSADSSYERVFNWPHEKWELIRSHFNDLGLDIELSDFDRFCRRVIEGREYAKFIFTRNLSQALSDLAQYGEAFDLDRQVLSGVSITDIFALRAGEGFGNPGRFIRQLYDHYELRRKITQIAELPPIISDHADFFAFYYPQNQPNFVGSKFVSAKICVINNIEKYEIDDIRDKIVVITQADPGFDWLFSCGIVGLVTAYGGANSHMAIRCAEFNIPAAMGVGEVMFKHLQNADKIMLDCSNRLIQINE